MAAEPRRVVAERIGVRPGDSRSSRRSRTIGAAVLGGASLLLLQMRRPGACASYGRLRVARWTRSGRITLGPPDLESEHARHATF